MSTVKCSWSKHSYCNDTSCSRFICWSV